MGFIASIFTLLFACFFINCIDAKIVPTPSDSQQLTNNEIQKRPSFWVHNYPVRRSKLQNANDIEFVDETDDQIRKRFDNYGHMRFGKRGGPGEGFDDYGDYG